MPKLPDIAAGFRMLREVDLNAISKQAESPLHIAVIGAAGAGKSTLIRQLLSGPSIADTAFSSPLIEYRLNNDIALQPHTVMILVIDATEMRHTLEQQFLSQKSTKLPLIVCYNKADLVADPQTLSNKLALRPDVRAIAISAIDRKSVEQKLVPQLMRIYRKREVLLARHLPMCRETVARKLINDTCFINATYSLSTGLAEINPILDLPLNIADIVVLTKNQALMSYKIALAMGLPSDWRQTIPKLATVVGGAFLWRQTARQLVGLIPAYGIIPKVAVSYAGTYAVGQAIYYWCANGDKLKPDALKSVYATALKQGHDIARSLIAKSKAARQQMSNKFGNLLLPSLYREW